MTKPGSQRNPTIDSLKDRIARDPFSRAFLQLAEEYRREARFQEAINVCLDGLQRHPTYHTARISLGRTYMEAGDFEKAKRTFMEVLELQPENHLAAKLLAEIQKKMGDLNGAAATYRGILSYYPNDREVATLLQETQRGGSPPAQTGPSAPLPAAAGRVPGPAAAPPRATPVMDTPVRKAPTASGPTGPFAAVPSPPRSATPHGRPSDPAPDFRPEDLGVGPSLASAASTGVPVVVGRPSWPAIRSDEEGMPTDDALQTNTLAELYLRQGLVDKATEVYRGMLRVDPGNHKAARRLGELGQGAASQPSASAGTSAPRAEVAALSRPAVSKPATVPVLQTKNDDSPRRDTIRRLERWLATVGAPAAKGGAPR